MLTRFVAVCLALCLGTAVAQEFPSKPSRLIIPFPPGGSSDLVGRQLAQHLSTALNQSVVPDNRGGANGILGAQAAVAAPADGYTLFLGASSVMAVNPAIYAKLPYDPMKTFDAVSMLSIQPLAIGVNPNVPAKTLKEFIALAKAKPGQLNFAGVGTSTSLAFLYLLSLADIKVQEVPFKGGGPGLTALLGGQVESIAFTLGTIYPQIQAGKVRALAVTSARRAAMAPQIPTVAESGFPGYEAVVWNGLVVPAGTPRPIIERLNRATIQAMNTPELRSAFTKGGIEIATGTPEAMTDYVRVEIQRWQKVARDANIQPQ